MNTKETFIVRLPLSDEQAETMFSKGYAPSLNSGESRGEATGNAIRIIGTPVSSDVPVACSINDADIQDLETKGPEYDDVITVSAPNAYGCVNLVRQSDHLAALAKVKEEAEKVKAGYQEYMRLAHAENERLRTQIGALGNGRSTTTIHSPTRFMEEDGKS